MRDVRLATLIREDPTLSERLKQVAEKVKEDDVKIRSMADAYNKRYDREIREGTAKKHLLITEGQRQGKTIEEAEQSIGRFIPTIYTPILNWLYFMVMIEGHDVEKELLREEQDEQYRTLLEEGEIKNIEKVPDALDYVYGNLTLEKFQTLKKLKRLSKSDNENEAFQAYRRCLELCKKHNIEFDRIPD
jgi:hypothetical protein